MQTNAPVPEAPLVEPAPRGARDDGAEPTRLLWVAYALSGLVSLGYQTIWLRVFVDRFGATNLTFVAVLVAFMTGLAAGAAAAPWLRRRWPRGTRSGIRAYGAIELGVTALTALTVALIVLPLALWLPASPYVESGDLLVRSGPYRAAILAVCAVCIFAPCFAMGLSFPWLCDCFAQRDGLPASLYAANTFGAVAGVLLTQLVLLVWLGHALALVTLLVLNGLLGLIALAAPGLLAGPARVTPRRPGSTDAGPEGPRREAMPEPAPAGHASAPEARATLLLVAVLTGAATGVLEGDLVKRVWLVGSTTTAAMVFVSLWAIVGIFIGAWLVRVGWVRSRRVAMALVAAGPLIYVLTASMAYPVRGLVESALAPEGAVSAAGRLVFALDPVPALVLTAVFALPAMIALSVGLPFVCNEAQRTGRGVAGVYAVNTAAFCVGLVVAGWLAPSVNLFYSLNLGPWLLAGVALAAAVLMVRGAWIPSAVCAVAVWAGAALGTSSAVDRALLGGHPPPELAITAVRSNGAHTTWVVDHPQGRRLYFDGHPMSGATRGARMYMRLMAHVPLLAQREPRRALLIGFGVGNTAAAIARHETIERIDVAELNHQVIATADEFEATNERVVHDPRMRIFHDDGRSFLDLTAERYDLITTEPPPPMQHGIARLYSEEFYRDARAHLTEDGLLSQWLPVSQLPREATGRMVAAFAAVFPDFAVVIGNGTDLLLVGGIKPMDAQRIVSLDSGGAAVRADLDRFDILDLERLRARIVGGATTLAPDIARARSIRDTRNDLGFIRFDPTADAAPVLIYPEQSDAGPVPLSAKLAWEVPDFPFQAIGPPRSVSAEDRELWQRQVPAGRDYSVALAAGDRVTAERIARRELGVEPDQPRWLMELGRLAFRARDATGAVEQFERLHALVPPSADSALLLASARAAAGRFDAAIEGLRGLGDREATARAVARGALLEGRILEQLGRRAEAALAYRRALDVEPSLDDARNGLRRLGLAP